MLNNVHSNQSLPEKPILLILSIVTVFALFVMLGWMVSSSALLTLLPGLEAMKFNTALCFVLASISLYAQLRARPWLARGAAGIIVLIAGLTLTEYSATPITAADSRMSAGAALCFLLAALALFNLTFSRIRALTQFFSMTLTTIVYLVFLSYIYYVEELYTFNVFNTMPIYVCILFLLLGVSIMAANPYNLFFALLTEPGTTGQLVRRLLPAIIVGPAVMGWITLQAARFAVYSTAALLALLVIGMTCLLLTVVVLTARSIHLRDLALRRANQAYRILSDCNQALIRAQGECELLADICAHIVQNNAYSAAQVLTPNADGQLVVQMQQLAPQQDFSPVLLSPILPQADYQIIDGPHHQQAIHLPMLEGLLVVWGNPGQRFMPQEIELLRELAGDLAFGLGILRQRQQHDRANEQIHFQASLLDNVLDAVIATDNQFCIRYWNNAAAQMYGWPQAEALGSTMSTLVTTEYVHDNGASAAQSLWETGRWANEVRQQRRDQSWLDVLSSVTTLRDQTGTIIGVVAVNRDITLAKQIERRLVEAQIAQAKLEADQELIRQREHVILTVSHEFRTPLTVIMTASQILLRYEDRLAAERRRELLEQIGKQINYILGMVQEMLDFSKIRHRIARQPSPERLELVAFCRELFDQLRLSSQSAAHFIFEPHTEAESVEVDKQLLSHILVNLIQNAIKYSPEGGEIRFKLEREAEWVRFIVCDEGIGIPEKDQALLFQPFFRAGNTRGINGTGLGMAIVQESVEACAGRIEVNSRENEGSTFIVSLPLPQR